MYINIINARATYKNVGADRETSFSPVPYFDLPGQSVRARVVCDAFKGIVGETAGGFGVVSSVHHATLVESVPFNDR